jgi:hypothetical protein
MGPRRRVFVDVAPSVSGNGPKRHVSDRTRNKKNETRRQKRAQEREAMG